ncbi:hypothetical protein HHI36_023015 [Cryptolaemus montrouzieri]|uniref:mRNA export factor GLE1 n=1 Tax=Cryptolaemus montrouzieri TaxID=559131 RepID=A0ABD2PFR9_9CUCU
MDDLLASFDCLKISAFSQVKLIEDEEHNVAINSNSCVKKPIKIQRSIDISTEKNLPYHQEMLEQVPRATQNCLKKSQSLTAERNTRKQHWLLQQQRFVESMESQMKEIKQALRKYVEKKSEHLKKENLENKKYEKEVLNKRSTYNSVFNNYSQKNKIQEAKEHILSIPFDSSECQINKLISQPGISFYLEEYISESNFNWYSKLISFHDEYNDSLKELLDDTRLKQFRFDCMKAVNLSVNAISAVSSSHLSDKYNKLSDMIHGQNVMFGDFQINASEHRKGLEFCINLIAKKFVLQGDIMISSHLEAAFSYATIILSLWNESSDFGELLLVYFFKECPYLIPFYMPRTIDQSDEDYYMSIGYRYSGGDREKQDHFLKRMTGIMRLYFAILISFPKSNQKINPLCINIAWTWFTSVLKLKPRKDITATMLHTFLEIVGFAMQNSYKNQFEKIVSLLVNQYIPTLKEVDSGGPVTRLENFIHQLMDSSYQFKAPSGILPRNFW